MKYPVTGGGRAPTWSLFNLMDEALGNSHATAPPLLISSSGGTVANQSQVGRSPSTSPKAKKFKSSCSKGETTEVLQSLTNQLHEMSQTDEELNKRSFLPR